MLMGLLHTERNIKIPVVSLFWAEFYSCYSPSLLCSLLSHITVCHQIILYCFMYKNLRRYTSILQRHCCHTFSTYIMNLQILQFYLYFIQSIIFYQSTIFLKNTFYLLKHLSFLVLFIPLCRSSFYLVCFLL